MSNKPPFIVVDIESTGLSAQRDRMHGFAIAYSETEAVYYRANAVPLEVEGLLADADVAKIGHKIRFDLKFLRANGFAVDGEFYCTKIMAHLLDENSDTGLKELSEKHLGFG